MMAGKSGVPRKRGALVLSRHTLWKGGVKTDLKHESGGRGKSRQHGRGGVEDRPAADIPADAAVEHRLAGGCSAHHSNEPTPRLEPTGERVRRDLRCPVDQDDIVRGGGRP